MSQAVTVGFRGLTFTGDGESAYFVERLVGWLEWPGEASFESESSPFGHGELPSPGVLKARFPTTEGWLLGESDTVDALIQTLRSTMVPASSADVTLEPLVITIAGETRTADAQLSNFAVVTEPGGWGSGAVRWRASWRCPDPRKYSDWLTTTVSLVTVSTGLPLPQTLPFTLAPSPLGGRASIFNPGDDPEGSPLQVTLVGGQSGTPGVQVIRPSGRVVTVTYPLTLQADRGDGLPDSLVIDTTRGGGYLNGEYRAPAPGPDVVADLQLPPGVSVVQSLGTTGAGSPDMTVAVRPRFW